MDSTPPSHRSETKSRTKSASRLARMVDLSIETEEGPLELISPSLRKTLSPSAPSMRSPDSIPLRELLLLSPSPLRRPKTRFLERLEIAEEPAEPAGPRRRCKNRASQLASPRNTRRTRKRLEGEMREEKDHLGLAEDIGKPRKRRHSGRSRKEKLSLVPLPPSSNSPPEMGDGDRRNLDGIGEAITDLIMWKDVAKSSLWFGFGCLCFLSSCFAGGIDFSIFSAISQLGLLFLGASFFSNSVCNRNNAESRRDFKLREDDILRMARLILPPANLAISKIRTVFSGEPSMTLKVAPLFLLGVEYGHLLTLRRLFAIGFFMSFTVPKLYSSYSIQIRQTVEGLKRRVLEAWLACSHKKIVASSAIMAFWNLASVKTLIFTAFLFLVILRCYRQNSQARSESVDVGEGEQDQEPQRALVVGELRS